MTTATKAEEELEKVDEVGRAKEEKFEGKEEKLKELNKQNTIKKPKKMYPGFSKNLLDYLEQFTGNIGVQGLKYVGERDRTLFEKVWWLIFFCLSLFIGIQQIIQSYDKWDTSPVLVNFAKRPTSISQIPFPAVTICPVTKSERYLFNFSDAILRSSQMNLTKEGIKSLRNMCMICDGSGDCRNIIKYEAETDTDIEYLMKVAPKLGGVFASPCGWGGHFYNCHVWFRPILTDEGLCFTSNMLDRSEVLRSNVYMHGDYNISREDFHSNSWTLENGYSKDAGRDTFPRRFTLKGDLNSLTVELREAEEDLEYFCKGFTQGYKVILHHPADIPSRSMMTPFRIPLNKQLFIAIKPDMMTTSEELRGYEPNRRGCYYPSEKYLAFFQSYSQQNCQLECYVNYTLARCGCVAYFMPHTKETKICGPAKTICSRDALEELLGKEAISERERYDLNVDENNKTCNCLPSCSSLTYNTEFTYVKNEFLKKSLSYSVQYLGLQGMFETKITFFYQQQQFIPLERNELFGQTDFIASCGGILGLFTGFSFLTIVEILYFLTLRVMCNVKRYSRHYWSGSERLIKDEKYVHL